MKLFTTTIHRDHWRQFLRRSQLRTYSKNEIILLQGQVPNHLHIIKSGVVRVYGISSEGEERTVSFDVTNEIFPIGWAFKEIEATQYFYEAWTEVQAYSVKRDDFLRYLKFHPKMAYELYANMATRITNMQSRIYALEQSKAADKVARALHYLVERFGVKTAPQSTRLDLPLTQKELANFIGLTRETTSLEIKKLERQKVLTLHGKYYQINITKLNNIIDAQ